MEPEIYYLVHHSSPLLHILWYQFKPHKPISLKWIFLRYPIHALVFKGI